MRKRTAVLPGVGAGQASGAADSESQQALTELASVCEQDPPPEQLPPEAVDLLPPRLREEAPKPTPITTNLPVTG